VPIYEYRCDVCGHTFEVFQKFSDAPVEVCESCGGSVQKVLHPVAIHFKGSGFYTTDYGRSASSRSASAEAASDGNKSASDNKKSESDGGAETSGGKAADDEAAATRARAATPAPPKTKEASG